MAKTENSRRFAAAPPADLAPAPTPADLAPAPTPADRPAAEPPESLDKVRDILFGGQMRAVDGRLQALEERLLHEQAQMFTAHGTQVATLEANLRRDLQSLAEQVSADRVKRGEELKVLGADLRDALRSLEKRHIKLEELGGAADAELRDSILEQSRAVSAQIERLSQRITADLSREVAGLRHDKADTSSLVGIFSDMAHRLGSTLDNGTGTVRDGARS
jgi:DNA anti-recombination protein RmuC